MKNKTYKFGHVFLKCHYKAAGHGYEVTVTFDKKTVFVGNFVHAREANRWWGQLNREISHFTKTYWWNGKATKAWYAGFLGNHLYKTYYTFLDQMFAQYNRSYARAFTRDARKYKTMKKHFAHTTATRFTLKAA